MDAPERILIVRLGGIGDVVCTLPALDALRAGFPDAFIGYAVEELAYDVVHNHPALDTVHLFRRRQVMRDLKSISHIPEAWKEIGQYKDSLRQQRYDLALDFQRNLKGAVHSKLSRATRQVGFTPPTAREFNHWFHREHVDPAPSVHWVDKFLAMAKAVGGKPEAARYRLPDSAESKKRVEAFLHENSIGAFIAMHPGTSNFDPARRWEPDRFGQVAHLIRQTFGIPTLITWGPGERELAERVAEKSQASAMVSFESKSVLDLAELYRKARCYVGCDTGPMHIATAVGLPSIVLFGSGNPAAYGPRSAGSKILFKEQNGTILPMFEITVSEVFSLVEEVLQS